MILMLIFLLLGSLWYVLFMCVLVFMLFFEFMDLMFVLVLFFLNIVGGYLFNCFLGILGSLLMEFFLFLGVLGLLIVNMLGWLVFCVFEMCFVVFLYFLWDINILFFFYNVVLIECDYLMFCILFYVLGSCWGSN